MVEVVEVVETRCNEWLLSLSCICGKPRGSSGSGETSGSLVEVVETW